MRNDDCWWLLMFTWRLIIANGMMLSRGKNIHPKKCAFSWNIFLVVSARVVVVKSFVGAAVCNILYPYFGQHVLLSYNYHQQCFPFIALFTYGSYFHDTKNPAQPPAPVQRPGWQMPLRGVRRTRSARSAIQALIFLWSVDLACWGGGLVRWFIATITGW